MMSSTLADELKNRRPENVKILCQLLSIPSISADPQCADSLHQAAATLSELFQIAGTGWSCEVVPTAGYPIVWARYRAPGNRRRAIVYGHYDVQPADPLDLWTTPPFEPTLRDGKIYARGATDDKGQMLTHILSALAWMKTAGQLPIDLDYIIEGEEEVGSENLERFLAEHRDELKADVAVISDTSQYAPGWPAITTGLRGIFACEVRVHGPRKDLHSGVFGGAIPNPIRELTRLLSLLHNEHNEVQVPGFYADVVPLTDADRAGFAELPFDQAAFLAETGAIGLRGEAGFTPLEQRWARPTLEFNGIYGGYTGPGPKTIVPASATAKITCRLVANQNPDVLMKSLEGFLRSQLHPSCRLEFTADHGCPAFLMDRQSPFLQAASKAIEAGFGKAPVFIREGGSIPVVATFKRLLEIDTLLLGWGQNTDNLHSPDEHFLIEDFHRGTLASAILWEELAKV